MLDFSWVVEILLEVVVVVEEKPVGVEGERKLRELNFLYTMLVKILLRRIFGMLLLSMAQLLMLTILEEDLHSSHLLLLKTHRKR